MYSRAVVDLHRGDRPGQGLGVAAVVEEVPDVDHLPDVGGLDPAQQLGDGGGPGERGPREGLYRELQAANREAASPSDEAVEALTRMLQPPAESPL